MRIDRITILALAATALTTAQPPGGGPNTQGDGIWLRNGYYGEFETFDKCLGHQPGNGQYHNHVQPVCLRAQLNDNIEVVSVERTGTVYREKTDSWAHSPILGWSFDGYPIYGPYGYSDPADPTSPVKRMQSSFQLRNMTERTSLPDWLASYHNPVPQQLTAAQSGPPVNVKYPLGRYIEDFEFVAGLGDLDQYNGRFGVTPQYPNGTYAYFVTIDSNGAPAFPYILGAEYYGSTTGSGNAQAVPSNASEYFNNGQLAGAPTDDAVMASFPILNSQTAAQVVIGWDPAAGPQSTWPGTQPKGAAQASGVVSTPTKADVQRIRSNSSSVFVNANGIPSYPIGPWFASMNGGVFSNFPSKQNYQVQINRLPQAATAARTKTPMGAAGVWVNGVAVFNALDGASYKASTAADVGGGPVTSTSTHRSAASQEGGPVTPGSLVMATANFDSVLAASTATADNANWPTTLAGATVTITDSSGATLAAPIFFASPNQLNYRVPVDAAVGVATVRITANGATSTGGLNIVPTYPGLFKADLEGLGMSVLPDTSDGVVVYATGLNGAADVTATIGGLAASVEAAAAQGSVPGLERIKLTVPGEVAGARNVAVVVTAGGRKSNPVIVNLQ